MISMRGGVPVLMYHALSPACTSGFGRWTLSPDRFESHLGYLRQEGYRAITVAELAERRRRGALDPSVRLIALTFDDAYADFLDVAMPALLRYGMTATMFVPTQYAGGCSGWMRAEGEGDRAVLSWPKLAEISRHGIEIGAHSHTHPELDTLPARERAEEARLPKLLLEERLGVPVSSFAYPFGLYDRPVREAVAAAGYTAACTMNSWAATPGDHPLELPRLAIFDDTDVPSLAARLSASRLPARRLALRARRVAQLRARRRRTRSGTGIQASGSPRGGREAGT
jgi:peptidoglycan/xylan/chitin deacetylase (PgdA/CDA1 family)